MNGNQAIKKVYNIGRALKNGAFGEVRIAIKQTTGEQFAVQIIQKKSLSNDGILALEILTSINHPNVIKIYEIYEDGTDFYIIMELMTGGDLLDRIELRNLSEKEAAQVLKPIIDALSYCHNMGIIHGNLQLENIQYVTMEPDALMKASDFGLASCMANDIVLMTQCGTPGYVAPEILVGSGYTEAIDFWSVGVILYIMLCGVPPFYDEDNEKLYKQIKLGYFSYPSPYCDTISNEGNIRLHMKAKNLISGLLNVDWKQRFNAEIILKHPWLTNNLTQGIQNIQDFEDKIQNRQDIECISIHILEHGILPPPKQNLITMAPKIMTQIEKQQ